MKAGNLLNIYDGQPLETLKIITSIEQINNLAQGTVCFYVGDNIEIEYSDQGDICTGDFFKIRESGIVIINRSINEVVLPSSSSSQAETLSEEETPLTLIAEKAGSTITLNSIIDTGNSISPTTSGLLYRTNMNEDWQTYTCGNKITLENIGDYVQFANTENTLSVSLKAYVKFTLTGSIKAYGNIQSMLSYNTEENIFSDQVSNYCYANLFSKCEVLTRSPKLPVLKMKAYCYYYLLGDCTNLVEAPVLPATTLAGSCYQNMLRYTSITTMPELPATTLAGSCYLNMFRGCSKMTTLIQLPATTLAPSCYRSMFHSCTALTSLISDLLPATTLASYCYGTMFSGCTNLMESPELPATTLVANCYNSMFSNCTNLNKIKVGFTEWHDTGTTTWLNNVASTGTFICPLTLDTTQLGTSYIPEGWLAGSEGSKAAPYEWLNILDSNYPENTISIPIATNSYEGNRYESMGVKSSLIQINLQAGKEYYIELYGDRDGYLYLLDSDFNLITQNDDNENSMKYSFSDYGVGSYTTSQIIYTPTTSGIYYVEATGYNGYDIDYINCRIAITQTSN